MNYRNCVITITCTAVLAIGYRASQLAEQPPARAQATPGPRPHDPSTSPKNATAETEPTPAMRAKKRTKPPSVPLSGEALRNPFALPDSSSRQPAKRSSSRLEEVELSKLRLVAVVRDIEGRIAASLEDPDGIGFLVRPGTAVGLHGGYVSEISPEGITIREPAPGDEGTSSTSDVRLALHPPSEGR